MNTLSLTIGSLNKNFDGIQALNDFSCKAYIGEILGIIGPNGAGKTTLFNVLTGFTRPDSGTAIYQGNNLIGLHPHSIARRGVTRAFQDLRLLRSETVLDNVLFAFPNQPGENLRGIFLRPHSSKKREEENREFAHRILKEIGLEQMTDTTAADLSYGQQKLLSLACCVASGAKLTLLDEPVAGIAPEMIDRVLEFIVDMSDEGKTLVIIEHNLEAVNQICDRVIFMDIGTKISEGTPEEVRNDPKVIEAYLE